MNYFKLLQHTECDAIEGLFVLDTAQIVAVTPANSEKEARQIFEHMGRKGIIPYHNGVTVEEATKEEFDDYINGY